jgi:hypothetical protein
MQKNCTSFGAGQRWDKLTGKNFAVVPLAAGSQVVLGCAGIRALNIGIPFLQWLMQMRSEIGKLIACDGGRQPNKPSQNGRQASPANAFPQATPVRKTR